MNDQSNLAMVLLAALLIWMPEGIAADFHYTYVEADWIRVDADVSANINDPASGTDARISTEDDSGFKLGGAWQFAGRWHAFGEYSSSDQDAEINGTLLGQPVAEGTGFDINRARIGVGYAWPFRQRFDLYGRVSFDWTEVDNIKLAGLDIGDNDDTGPGFEIGSHWAPWRGLELDLSLRYTDVGEIKEGGDIDQDVLAGLDVRWWFSDRWGLQLESEFGEIKTLGAGVRVNL